MTLAASDDASGEPFASARAAERSASAHVVIHVSAPHVFYLLATAISLILLAHVMLNYFTIDNKTVMVSVLRNLLDIDQESSIPSFFSSLLLLSAAGLLALRALLAAGCDDRRWRAHWWLLAVGFLALACDEAVQLHERAGGLVPAGLRPPALAAAWVLPASALVAGLALLYLPFVRALPRRSRALFLGSGAVYLLGALGLEAAGSLIVECYRPGCQGFGSPAYGVEVLLEEACEMLGAAWFVYALLDHLARLGFSLSLRVAPSGAAGVRIAEGP